MGFALLKKHFLPNISFLSQGQLKWSTGALASISLISFIQLDGNFTPCILKVIKHLLSACFVLFLPHFPYYYFNPTLLVLIISKDSELASLSLALLLSIHLVNCKLITISDVWPCDCDWSHLFILWWGGSSEDIVTPSLLLMSIDFRFLSVCSLFPSACVCVCVVSIYVCVCEFRKFQELCCHWLHLSRCSRILL